MRSGGKSAKEESGTEGEKVEVKLKLNLFYSLSVDELEGVQLMNGIITERTAAGCNESEAIARAQQGDALAFECLYKAHCKHVYSLCLRMLRNMAEAEDLTQQVFLQLFRKIGTFRGDSSFSTWLHRISVNAVLMHLRRKRPLENQMDSLDDAGAGNSDPRESARNPLSMPAVIDRLNLTRAIRRLPAGYKRFFLLHDVLGYRHAEIAARLGCSIGCSKSQLHKARKSLRRMLQGEPAGQGNSRALLELRHIPDQISAAVKPAAPLEKSSTDYCYGEPNCLASS